MRSSSYEKSARAGAMAGGEVGLRNFCTWRFDWKEWIEDCTYQGSIWTSRLGCSTPAHGSCPEGTMGEGAHTISDQWGREIERHGYREAHFIRCGTP